MTSVCKSIKAANPAAGAPRATRSKFALQASARKLRFMGFAHEARFPSPGLVGCKSRKHKSGGGLRARASCAASAISHTLANLTTWRLPRGRLRIVIWLILPVVICLSQRLSHACLSTAGDSEAANSSLQQPLFLGSTLYLDNCGNSRANTCIKTRRKDGRIY